MTILIISYFIQGKNFTTHGVLAYSELLQLINNHLKTLIYIELETPPNNGKNSQQKIYIYPFNFTN